VAATAEGDVVTGSSDGTVRVWTRDVGRAANEGERKALEEEVGKQKVDQNSIGDLKKQNVPGMEALDKPGLYILSLVVYRSIRSKTFPFPPSLLFFLISGSKEGQVITVKNASNVVEAHQWSTATSSWTKIGEVVDAVGSNRKQLFNGIEYDYVFDVDITEGAPPLKLPYNASGSHYCLVSHTIFLLVKSAYN
jgi:phospholipase A-2-activating protein